MATVAVALVVAALTPSSAYAQPVAVDARAEVAAALYAASATQAAAGRAALAGARANYEECLTIRRRLVEADPNALTQQELMSSLQITGAVAFAQSDWNEALSIAEALLAQSPGSTQWQTEVRETRSVLARLPPSAP